MSIDNEQLIEDVMTLLDGFSTEFIDHNTRWTYMSVEQKKKWFNDFSCRHARPIIPEEI